MTASQINKKLKGLFSTVLALVILLTISTNQAQASSESGGEEFNASDLIMHHVLDDHIWHFFDGHYGTLYLPVIVYSSEKGLDVFSSGNFYDDHHNLKEYNGYKLNHGHITLVGSGAGVLDLSITKNVLMLLLTAGLVLYIFLSVAKGYKTNEGKAPKGIQSVFEPVIVYLRDEVIKPNIGHGYEKYMPYLLTLFFFILIGNLFGLLPGAANLTGNIAVTMVLAVFTFFFTNLSGNKHYWTHILWTPGVPLPLRPIILLVEVIGVFTKPISLMVRLFVAITAGHIVILSLICLAFIFKSVFVGFGASLIVLFINIVELLVAGIQAYVFTMFSALYIGLATEDHH